MREEHVWPLVSADTMGALDRHTIEELGVPGGVLMECAGMAVARAVVEERGAGAPVHVVCGGGSNGGDGLVAARHLHLRGVPVRVALLSPPGKLRGDAAENLERARAVEVPFVSERKAPEPGAVVVDAIFGTGLSRDVEGGPAAAIRRILRSRGASRVVAVDMPSGVCARPGRVLGVAVQADRTVTVGLPKLGLALEPGRSRAGRVTVARIGIADEAPGVAHDAELWTGAAAARRLPARPADGHKGSFGHVLVVAGSEGKTGAAALVARGAARAGAGLVTVACPRSANTVLEVKCTEPMTAPVAATADGRLAAEAAEAVRALAAERDVVAMGPGFGREDEPRALALEVGEGVRQPLVLDADGLVAFADDLDRLRRRRAPTVLTPHPGEAGRLLDASPGEINADRPAAARALAEATGAVVVLKGAATVIAGPDGRLAVNPTGGPLLASGGTGDVLTGVVAGLLGQGLAAFEAAALGAWLHGAAADRLAATLGLGGALASEVADALPAVVHELRTAGPARTPRAAEAWSGDALAFPEPR